MMGEAYLTAIFSTTHQGRFAEDYSKAATRRPPQNELIWAAFMCVLCVSK